MALSSLLLVSGLRGRAQDQAEPGLVGEPPRPLDPAPPAAREGDERRHVVGDEFLGHAAEDPERLEQAREQVVGRPPRGGDEDVPAGVAQRRREHVELEDLAVRVDHPDVLLPVELQLPARRGLEPGVGLGGGGPENQPRPPAPCGEGAVPGERRVVVHMEQELVHRPLRHPGQRRLLRGDVPDALEGALPLRPPIRGVRPSDQYLATVCLSMPCLLAMSLKFGFAPAPLYMFSSPMTFLSIRAPSEGLPYVESVFAFARLVKVRLREWRLFVSANGGMRLRDWLFLH